MGEVIDATLHLIDNPDAEPSDLMQFVKGPDFPTGGLIMGRAGIVDAYKTGKGSIKMRAKAEIVEGKTNDTIVITELPYQVSPNAVFSKIKELLTAKELDGISDINDFSSQGETNIEIKLKRDAPALVVLNNLYKRTPLQTSFSMNAVALVDGVPRTLNLRELLVPYIKHQVEVITRRSQFRLDKAKARAHILEGLIKALDLIDEIIATIRASEDRAEALAGLMDAPFEFTELQAGHILDMQLGRLTRLGRAKLEEELAELRETIADLEAILNDEGRMRQVIKDQLIEVRDEEADERRSELMHDPGEIDIEDLIDDEDLIFTMSAGGYVKTMSIDEFRTQSRGGRGVAGANLKDDDYVVNMIHTTAHAYLLFFSNRGKVYRLKAHQIPMTSRTARGTAIVNLLQLQPEEKIRAIIDTRDYETNRYLFFATKLGRVKKTLFNAYDSNLKAGLIAIKLNDGDELMDVIPLNEGQDVFLVSKNGQTIRFDESAVRAMGRTAAGVRGMKFREGDELVASAREQADTRLLIITSEGYGKQSELEQYPVKGRGGLGVRGIRVNEKKGRVVAAFMVGEGEEIMLIGDGGTLIRTAVDDISTQGRDASGVRVMNVNDGHHVAAVARVLATGEEDLGGEGEGEQGGAPTESDATESAADSADDESE